MPAGEISTKAIVIDALRRGKKVFVPYIYKNQAPGPPSLMDMVALQSEQDYDSLKLDKWGIPTPDSASVSERVRCLGETFGMKDEDEEKGGSGVAETLLEHLDLIVVPGVAFDADRQRLGHGKGYYDNFLSQYHSRRGTLNSNEMNMPYLGECTQMLGTSRSTADRTVGVGLRQQVLPVTESVPVDSSDWRLDAVITEETTTASDCL